MPERAAAPPCGTAPKSAIAAIAVAAATRSNDLFVMK
jgi:hypothetical protein